ncbi:MAG: class II aldolase/adducin family protein, partial [Hoeflea sp.]|nr:class II aldolase/adducin family protein [Hoeflea sp.]
MRQNRWNDKEAQARVEAAGTNPADRTLALRVYSSRIIGADPDLVMHGGGNTSVKTERPDLFGVMQPVLHVKGSGWDLDTLEAAGLPGVRLDALLEMRQLDALSDEDMVNMQRSNLLDSSAPNPSVETLLHAFLPHTFVDHTHATAFLALANLPEPEAAIREIFGDRLAVVPYIMPGFALAKKAAEVFDAHPDCEGIILLKHGHFTFGATAKESYDKVIAHTNLVEDWLAAKNAGRRFAGTVKRNRTASAPEAAAILPVLRGAIGRLRGDHHRAAPLPVVMDMRGGEVIDAFLGRPDLQDLARRGVASPDHVIRTKGRMLVLGKDDLAQ